ncbi:MAG: DUF6504 family protein [Phycisphaerae bacterium]
MSGEKEQFISQPIRPVGEKLGTAMMAIGEPALPEAFVFRGREYRIETIQASWKTSAREGHSRTGELYLRRHWYRVACEDGSIATIYCDRQARNRNKPGQRWFVYSACWASTAPGTESID